VEHSTKNKNDRRDLHGINKRVFKRPRLIWWKDHISNGQSL